MTQFTSLSAHWEVKQVSLVTGITYSKHPLYTGPLGLERKEGRTLLQLHRELRGQGAGGAPLASPAGARIDSAAS